jgi:hypothetical protein
MKSFSEIVAVILFGFLVILVLGLLLSFPVMLLWNACLVPAIPAIMEIGWLQAWGILVLFGILFKPNASNNSK